MDDELERIDRDESGTVVAAEVRVPIEIKSAVEEADDGRVLQPIQVESEPTATDSPETLQRIAALEHQAAVLKLALEGLPSVIGPVIKQKIDLRIDVRIADLESQFVLLVSRLEGRLTALERNGTK